MSTQPPGPTPTVEHVSDTCRRACALFGVVTGEPPALVSTGFPAVDEAIGGVVVGTGAIIGARTGVGKSSLVLATVLSDPEDVVTGWVSLEDGPDVIGPRVMAQMGRVNSLNIRRGALTDAGRRRALRGMRAAKNVPLWLSYTIGGRASEVRAAIRALAERGCQRIVVDHLHRIRGESGSRAFDVADAHAELQAAFAETQTAGIVVAQVRRTQRQARQGQGRQADGKLPRLTIHDLKDSGDLENDARLILLIDKLPGELLEVTIAKSTAGGEGLTFSYRRDQRGNLVEAE